MVVTTISFTHTTFLWATCCLICFISIVKSFLTHWSWLRFVPFIYSGNRAHSGGCDQSTGDAYSSMAPDPTSDIFRGPYTPFLWFVFPIGLMRLITVRYFCHFKYIHSKLPDCFQRRYNKIFIWCRSWGLLIFIGLEYLMGIEILTRTIRVCMTEWGSYQDMKAKVLDGGISDHLQSSKQCENSIV
jgi:hypothetical protein